MFSFLGKVIEYWAQEIDYIVMDQSRLINDLSLKLIIMHNF